MKTLLTFICSLTIALAFSQPTPPIVYKNVDANYFSKGDRIWMGEAVTVTGTKTNFKNFTIAFSDSMEVYRKFVQSNPNLAFQLNFYWRQEGVKYPGRSDAVRDSLLEYFTTLTDDGVNPCQQMIYSYKHRVQKQKAILQLELEVVGAQTINGYGRPVKTAVGLPDWNVLYRNYDNKIEFAVSVFADSTWLEGVGCDLSSCGPRGGYIARVTTTGREAMIMVRSVINGDTLTHAKYPYRVMNLPFPSIYYGNIPMNELETEKDSYFNQITFLRVGYPPDVPLNVTFDVGETIIKVGDKMIVCHGKMLSAEYWKAFEEAEAGTVITFVSVGFKGPISGTVSGPWKHTKKSPKGTKLAPSPPTFSKGC